MKIEEVLSPPDGGRDLIARHLRAHNRVHMPRLHGALEYALYLHDGAVVGGLWAEKSLDWMFVDLLYVPDALRGQGVGASLMARAEDRARALDARGVWLGTMGFQARGFYERLGYELFGTLEGAQRDADEYFLRKTFYQP